MILGVAAVAAEEALGLLGARQQRREIDTLGFPLGKGLIEVQAIGAPTSSVMLRKPSSAMICRSSLAIMKK